MSLVFECALCEGRPTYTNLADFREHRRTAHNEMVLPILASCRVDDPQWDATDAAHPAWWRGHDHTSRVFCDLVTKIIDHRDDGAGFNHEPWQTLRRRLLGLVGDLDAVTQRATACGDARRGLEVQLQSAQHQLDTDREVLREGTRISNNAWTMVAELRLELEGYEKLVEISRRREAPWIARWQTATGKYNTLPDYGEFLEWVLTLAEQAHNELLKTREAHGRLIAAVAAVKAAPTRYADAWIALEREAGLIDAPTGGVPLNSPAAPESGRTEGPKRDVRSAVADVCTPRLAAEAKRPEERGWLIEWHPEPFKTVWWTGQVWSPEASAGLRFARKQDAEAAIFCTWRVFTDARATEHVWS